MIRRVRLIAGTVFTEAIRRREIYVIVFVTVALLGMAATVRFFDIKDLSKFYTEISLKAMSLAAALTTIVLAARQLPREFEQRTIYPLLAKPIRRVEFMLGKYFGVVCAGLFCLALFMGVFIVGQLIGHHPIPWLAFLQYTYLQGCLLALLAALGFLLSLVLNFDATVTISVLIYVLGAALTNALLVLYDYTEGAGRVALTVLNYTVPQPSIFDLSARVVHAWPALSAATMALAAVYALMFIAPYLGLSYLILRRKPL